MIERKCCGNCKWNKRVFHESEYMGKWGLHQEWECQNYKSDNYALETADAEVCTEWEEKQV